jgi:EAL domain-containing protein (putative c-di-GMP-specific phosphodiesterase class I)
VEALVRWRHPTRGLIPPDQFIPLAEETGLIVALGEWIITKACDDATSWPDDAKVSVNLSPVQFKQAELFDVIESALQKSGLRARAARNRDHRISAVGKSCRESCLHGAAEGHRGFACTRRLWHQLFVAKLPDHVSVRQDQDRQVLHGQLVDAPKSSAIISSIVTLARGLDMSVTAEGVGMREQLESLKTLGVNFAQGYLLGRPMPIGELEAQPPTFRSHLDAA